MKSIKIRVLWGAFVAFSLLGGVSCNDISNDSDDDDVYDEIEQLALDNYMLSIPDAEKQSVGYYILGSDMSSTEGTPGEEGVWVRYDITSRSLDGDICNTRDEWTAKLLGTFNYVTHYVPAFSMYVDLNEDEDDEDDDDDDDEEEESALVQALRYGVEINGVQRSLYAGNKFTLYSPSRLNGTSYNGTGGYAGQYSLSSGRPMISEIEIVEIVANATVEEQRKVDHFMSINPSGWKPVSNPDVDQGVYINQDFTHDMLYNYVDEYVYGELCKYYDDDYNIFQPTSFAELESLIIHLIEEEDVVEAEADDVDDDRFDEDDGGYVYYILRTLDGFIVDTNIGFVQQMAFGTGSSSSSIYYSDDSMSDYIDAWMYAIPELDYGKWASILTTSTYAYGTTGQTGSSSATEIPPYTPLLFNIYIVDND